VIDQRGDDVGVLGGREAVAVGRRGREPEAGQVDGDAAELVS
jgi:hypothetical protein